MPELVEQMYCSQQIVVPPKYPYILKRFCKAALKTQPYDLLRWSYEYFKALVERRPPPVKLRLEYPVYGTDGGLTRGCLKVLVHQLAGMKEVPITIVKRAWQGFCLDPHELVRILCYCEVYTREENVPFLHFVAVAGGMLTTCLTHTMILLCETLTDEPDGGSAAIPVADFLVMYLLLAKMDASKDHKYIHGYREGYLPESEEEEEEEEVEIPGTPEESDGSDYWEDKSNLVNLSVTGDRVTLSNRLSVKMNFPIIGTIERSPSVERASMIERENYMRERKERPSASEEVDKLLLELSTQKVDQGTEKTEEREDQEKIEEEEGEKEESKPEQVKSEEVKGEELAVGEAEGEIEEVVSEVIPVGSVLDQMKHMREERVADMIVTLEELGAIVDKYKSTNYDLGMIAGRQMSTTSGEFVVQHIEREIMDYIDEQIAILPDPDLKRKKAKPEEVAMIRDMIETFLEENMDVICPEVEEVEEEEEPIPEIVTVYAIPGIGPPVEPDIIDTFVEFASDVSRTQADQFMPRNIRHFLCPPLEKLDAPKYSGYGMRAKIELPEK